MMNVQLIQEEALQKIQATQTADELFIVSKEYFGRKSGVLTQAMKELKNVSPEEKKEKGKELNVLKKELEVAIEVRQSELDQKNLGSLATDDALDLTMRLPKEERGHLHLIPEFIRQVEEVFGRMGFDTAYGPEIESEEYNFDLLNFPKEHAARDHQDIFYIEDEGEEGNRMLLRGHTSPVQIRYMKEHKPPFRMICPGKTFRKDADATHSPMFGQFEGLMVGRDVSLRHMKGVMATALRELISPDLTFRFRTGYFPFVEPGLEMDMQWTGEKETKEGKWLEVCGCGMVHPNVLENVGIDSKEWQGFAFGFGVERLLMIKHQIPNIKMFYNNDVRFLRQF